MAVSVERGRRITVLLLLLPFLLPCTTFPEGPVPFVIDVVDRICPLSRDEGTVGTDEALLLDGSFLIFCPAVPVPLPPVEGEIPPPRDPPCGANVEDDADIGEDNVCKAWFMRFPTDEPLRKETLGCGCCPACDDPSLKAAEDNLLAIEVA